MSDEEKYVHDREQEKIDKIRRDRLMAAIQAEEKEGIAAILDSTEAIAAEALALGFDKKTVRILHLVPLLQVAWTDGIVDEDEKVAILTAASKHGIQEGSEAFEFLSLLMSHQPSNSFFARTQSVIANLLEDNDLEKEEILKDIESVAQASGGLFGLGKVSAGERELITELKSILKL